MRVELGKGQRKTRMIKTITGELATKVKVGLATSCLEWMGWMGWMGRLLHSIRALCVVLATTMMLMRCTASITLQQHTSVASWVGPQMKRQGTVMLVVETTVMWVPCLGL